MKKSFLIYFVFCFVASFITYAQKWELGNNVFCEVQNKTLIISGNGDVTKEIPYSDFYGDEDWRYDKIIIKEGITSIGKMCCRYRKFSSISLHISLKHIGMSAFYSCEFLKNITIPDGVTTIEERAFSDCIRLTAASIGNNVISIGKSAFSGCKYLDTVTLGDNVTNIGTSVKKSYAGTYIVFASTLKIMLSKALKKRQFRKIESGARYHFF